MEHRPTQRATLFALLDGLLWSVFLHASSYWFSQLSADTDREQIMKIPHAATRTILTDVEYQGRLDHLRILWLNHSSKIAFTRWFHMNRSEWYFRKIAKWLITPFFIRQDYFKHTNRVVSHLCDAHPVHIRVPNFFFLCASHSLIQVFAFIFIQTHSIAYHSWFGRQNKTTTNTSFIFPYVQNISLQSGHILHYTLLFLLK